MVNDKKGGGNGKVTLYSADKYYGVQKAKWQGIGLRSCQVLFKFQMLTEQVMQGHMKKVACRINNDVIKLPQNDHCSDHNCSSSQHGKEISMSLLNAQLVFNSGPASYKKPLLSHLTRRMLLSHQDSGWYCNWLLETVWVNNLESI